MRDRAAVKYSSTSQGLNQLRRGRPKIEVAFFGRRRDIKSELE